MHGHERTVLSRGVPASSRCQLRTELDLIESVAASFKRNPSEALVNVVHESMKPSQIAKASIFRGRTAPREWNLRQLHSLRAASFRKQGM